MICRMHSLYSYSGRPSVGAGVGAGAGVGVYRFFKNAVLELGLTLTLILSEPQS